MEMNPLVPELYCSDIQESLDFYCRVLGFAIVYERPEEKFAFLEREGAQIMIEQPTAGGRTWLGGTLEKPFGRGINLQIQVSDVDALCAAIKKNMVAIFLDLEEKWYRQGDGEIGNRQCVIQDPDGYLLRFSQHLGTRHLS